MSLNVRSSVEVNTSNAQASINNLTQALNRFNEQGRNTSNQLSEIAKNTNTFIDKMAHSAQALNGWWDILNGTVGNTAQSFIKIADSANLLNARLKLSTDGIKNFENASKGLYNIAQNTANSMESVGNLFITLNRTFSDLGYSQEKALEVTSTLSTALKAGGASAIDAQRAITQFSQALSTGKLQGQQEEF